MDMEIKQMREEYTELESHKKLADNQIIRERELKYIFEAEVGKLKEANKSQKLYVQNLENKIKDLQGNLDGVHKDKETGLTMYATKEQGLMAEIEKLRQILEEKEEVIEDMRYKLQVREEIEVRSKEERERTFQEMKEQRINENEQKMYKITKLIGEVADLSQKLSESEFLRKKYI